MIITDKKLDNKIFRTVGQAAADLGMEAYVVGGWVRDLLLDRHSKDIDFVTVGSGIDLAKEVAKRLGRRARCNYFPNFGTAQVKTPDGTELEFVGARKESYRRESRKPIVEDGTLTDDISRRDFTINAMAIDVHPDRFGLLVDMFDGEADLKRRRIVTPLDPDITFSDDPLRMLRAIRFATQLNFSIDPVTLQAISRNAERVSILSKERIEVELNKIMASPKPSIGLDLLHSTGLLKLILPEVEALTGIERIKGRGHKDNFRHTLQVLDSVAAVSDNLWLRWAALLHDVGKPKTKRWDETVGWTFHAHDFIGAKMIPAIFRNLKLPMNEHMKYVQKLVSLHMRPIALVDEVTDSAIRRLLFDAGEDIDDLMILCRADITSKNPDKVKNHLLNYENVVEKMHIINEKDNLRNWQPPVDGNEIMQLFGLQKSPLVGEIKNYQRERLLDCNTPNNRQLALSLVIEKAAELGLHPLIDPASLPQPDPQPE
ncbi:MAG: CCA tRNA nucleotidyltransferase [Muribaculaceae bacterium]|nr:CCA tRNA nucleotidyltransferase [Muribaculaceae bacterium]